MKKLITIAALLAATTITTRAQQALTYTQYAEHRSALNPAASLLQEQGEFSFIGRRQWVGLEGAPTAYWGSGHIGLPQFGATVGLNIKHESMAVEDHLEASVFFAKAVRISEKEYIGLSLNAGLSHVNGNFSALDPQDPTFRDDVRETDVMTGFGVMLYSPERYYVGLSLPRLMLSTLGLGGMKQYDFRNQYHLIAGALVPMGADFHLKPSLLVTYAQSLRPQADIGAMVFVKRVFGVGLNVRSYGEVAGMVQLNFGGLGIGYSYQFNARNEPLNRRINNTTHEVGLRYRFGKSFGLL
ncbi:PorP/SprF family type IX secretion system membrane protein [Parapedobacter soli]|uniref:PorP/SprF family type IX secretion system membrane protein n=1 Tax=Parapedobacter soli TaxID=416955 RepID=UPI0021CACD89|nr:PorP/SprF family type IX secretion system membrane protein [Parapedobacter soli]